MVRYRKFSTLRIVYLITHYATEGQLKRLQLQLFTEGYKLRATTYLCTPAVAFQAPLLFQRLQPLSFLWSQFRLRGPWWPGKVYTVLLFKVKTILDNSMFKPQFLRLVVEDYIIVWVSSTRGKTYYFVTYLLKSCSQHAKEKRRKIVSFYKLFSRILLNTTKHLCKTLLGNF